MTRSTSDYTKYTFAAHTDSQDLRDKYYEPDIISLQNEIIPPKNLIILDQGKEGSCTGFALAGVINFLNQQKGNHYQVSQRMLYEMAKRFDRWPGEDYSGSSCRGAILGWYNMGVCSLNEWPYKVNDKSWLTIERAKDARNTTIGAFYRLNPCISDVHAALNMVGVIYASANIHRGWFNMIREDGIETIPIKVDDTGGHAFAIVGYNSKGFFVQNSWGDSWGEKGVGLWKYEDWQENVKDMWTVRLAVSTPQLFNSQVPNTGNLSENSVTSSKNPIRANIAGHFVHIDDGYFDDDGKYWSNLNDIKETANLVAKSDKYEHFLIYAHGGLNNIGASASRIAAMKSTFKANKIYPFHFMYDTGLLEEIKDVVIGKKHKSSERSMGFTDWTDNLIEKLARKPGRAIWNEMKEDARLPFHDKNHAGYQTLKAFVDELSRGNKPKKIHLVGHSTGGILIAHLLSALNKIDKDLVIDSCNLMAPACSIDLFELAYLPYLKGKVIKQMRVYNLNEKLELDDNVSKVYRKSLLYSVSNSFESKKGLPLLGMQKFTGTIDKIDNLTFINSNGKSESIPTESKSHGGFDNDPATMNDILRTILDGDNVNEVFTKQSLKF